MSDEEEKKKQIYKKWWFWLIILAIIIVISFTIIMGIALNTINSGTNKVAIDIQNIDNEATVYTSAGGNNLIIELNNWNSDNRDKKNQILTTVREKVNNGEMKSYTELTILTYINSAGKSDSLFIKSIYKLPDFTLLEQKEYIDFNEYEKLFNTYDKAMDGYTGLFNSIY